MSRLSKEPFDCIASTSQESHEEAVPNLSSTRTLRVTLLSSEWKSTKGGVSTINRELAIQLAKQPNVDVTVYLPECREDDRQVADTHKVQLIGAEKLHGLEPDLWLSCLPHHHAADCVIGHGVDLGRQVQLIQHQRHCKWIQVVHTDPEELGMFKSNADAIPKGEKQHQLEVKLCELSDQVVAVGPKLADAFSGYLRPFGKDQNVLNLTPGIFSEFSGVEQASEERRTFSVLVLGHGNSEDLQLKGYDIAAKAIAELKDNSQPYKLKVVGAPSGKEKQVAEMFLQQGIDRSQLVVRGFKEREQLATQFCEVDLAIMPSRSEGFGLAALEALSAGLPVLISSNSGLGEAFRDVLCGSICVVDSEHPKDWAKAISRVRNKRRDLRLWEAKLICDEYAKRYSWGEQCRLLVQRMRDLTTGSISQSRPTQAENEESLPSSLEALKLLSSFERVPPKRPRKVMVEDLDQGSFSQSRQNRAEKRKRLKEGAKQRLLSPKQRRQVTLFDVLRQGSFSPSMPKQEENEKRLPSSFEKRRLLSFVEIIPSMRLTQAREQGSSVGVQSSATCKSFECFPDSSHTRLRSAPEGLDHTVVRFLRAEYTRRSFSKPLLWVSTFKLPIEDVYTRLKMLPRQKNRLSAWK